MSSAIDRLENWLARSKAHGAQITHDDGMGAGSMWEIELQILDERHSFTALDVDGENWDEVTLSQMINYALDKVENV